MPSGIVSGLIWAGVIVGLWFIGSMLARRRSIYAVDRPELAYAAFTREYDLILPSADVPAMLAGDGVEGEAPRGSDVVEFGERQARFDNVAREATARLAEFDARLNGQAICFLLDMSGSMVARMPDILAELQAIHAWLVKHDARCAVLGFTTRGWRGGLSRRKWAAEGRPSYPGRLCALMHVMVADFGATPATDDWSALLRPDALRENVDGEAIRWAVECLDREVAHRRRLIVLSDGAPVDDSTLSENGRSYLWQNLNDTIAAVERTAAIELVGIGLSHRVESLYENSAYLADGSELTTLVMPIILDDRCTAHPVGESD